jgi:O-antigen biosynthesis protein
MTASINPQSISRSASIPILDKFKHLASFSKFWERIENLETDFDWQFYLDYYKDLCNLTTAQQAYEHWIVYGQFEGRFASLSALKSYLEQKRAEIPADFDAEGYWVLNPDIRNMLSNQRYGALQITEHFLRHGRYEARLYQSEFDWKFYIEFNNDLGLSTYEEAYDHWLEIGSDENRVTSSKALWALISLRQAELAGFDYRLYLELNPDLYHRFHHDQYKVCQAIEHFLRCGMAENRLYRADNLSLQLRQFSEPTKGHNSSNLSLKPSPSAYDCWLRQNTLNDHGLRRLGNAAAIFKYQPLISVVMPTYNTPEKYLRAAIESVLKQVYANWELCIADDASTEPHVRRILEEFSSQDSRIKLSFRVENGHISAASNTALTLAKGEFVAFLDHDDVLTPDALYEAASFLNKQPDADMLYSDEDKLDEQGQRSTPFFKPDWSPDSFLSRMYTCHLAIYRRSLITQVGGLRVGFEGSQDYDLVLRITEATDKIYHLPQVLYHWRIHQGSVTSTPEAKPYAYEAAKRALTEAICRRGEPGEVLDTPGFKGLYTVRYKIKDYKRVSIIIPTRDMGKMLNACLESIFSQSTYPNYEVILIDNGSVEQASFQVFEYWQTREPQRFHYYQYDVPFNYSRINNYGVSKAKGDYLLFLNNDTEIISPDWIEAMVEHAQRRSIGAVGAQLLYADQTIQHAGVVVGLGGIAGHGHQHFPANNSGHGGQIAGTSNVSAVTGACLMCRAEVFREVGGLDEILAVAYNDIDLCLKLAKAGYQNVYLPHVQLYHYESKSRGYEDTPEKQTRWRREVDIFVERWQEFIAHDPCYNPNLTRFHSNYSFDIEADSVEILSADLCAVDQSELLGFAIDSPKVGSRLNSAYFTVAGWVVGKKSPAIEIEIISRDRTLYTIAVNRVRPDVAQVYINKADAISSGFSATLEMISDACEHDLLLQAVLENGHKVPLRLLKLKYEARSWMN